MTAHLAALTICVASVVLGAALCCAPGQFSWTAVPAGLGAVIVLALVAVRLPGHGSAAAVALALAVLVAAVRVWRARLVPADRLAAAAVIVGVLAFCSLPFAANARFGELGQSTLDDLVFHMGQADAMRTSGADAHVTGPGYPTGPHALVAGLSTGTGIGISPAFTGLMLATAVLTALASLAAFQQARWPLRVAGATAVGVAYLASAYMAQGAFKEPLLALFFLGFVLTLREVARGGRVDARHVAAFALTMAGAVGSFGAAALAWPAAATVAFGAFTLVGGGRWAGLRLAVPRGRRAVAGAGLAGAAVGLLILGSRAFFESGPGQFLDDTGLGGNFLGHLDPFQALGVWPSGDFRFRPGSRVAGPGLVVAIGVVVAGLAWCWRRREWALLAGVAAVVGVYVVARPVTLAYFSGKALVVAAPMITLAAVAGLAAAISAWRGTARGLVALALGVYLALVWHSSATVLRAATVRPGDRGPDIAAFRDELQGQPTLYAGRDNFAGWDVRGARLSGFQAYPEMAVRLDVNAAKGTGVDPFRTMAVDVDSIDARSLDGFRYLITNRTAFASRVPSNFRRAGGTRWHVLWRRTGPTGRRRILAEGESPGAVLDCSQAEGRRLRRAPGTAYIRPRPVVASSDGWRDADGSGRGPWFSTEREWVLRRVLRLPRGTWDLSLRYYSDVDLRLEAPGVRASLPAYIGDASAFLSAGRVVSRGGPVTVTVVVPRRRRLDVHRRVKVGTLAATRIDRPGRLVPLGEACGRYVDWYRPRA